MCKRAQSLCLTVLCAVALLVGTKASGQQVFGSIFGTVTDPTGAAVANATVTITDQEKGTVTGTTTNADGNYTKGNLIPGTYSITVESPGFSKAVSRDITVNINQASRVDVAMQVGNSPKR